ncbi:MAG: hypothetical protein AAF664_23415 [Planctomycetota bacterium]
MTLRGTIALATLLLTPAFSHADLVLSLMGRPHSNVIEYEAFGSIVVTQNTSRFGTSGVGRAPVGGSWDPEYDSDLGNFLRNSMNTSRNDDLLLSDGGVSYRRNGIEFGVFQTLDFDGSGASGGDDIEFDPTISFGYPALSAGDVISWVGSGTLTLEDGETFDTLFVENGTFANLIDGGSFVVNINPIAVPEPSSALYCGFIMTLSGLSSRRRSRLYRLVTKTS